MIIGDIGINHNGKVDNAIELIRLAKKAGFDAVKFQKRTPELYPEKPYNSPLFGEISYREHKQRLELSFDDYCKIDEVCGNEGIEWFASCFDIASIDFISRFNRKLWKIASPSITDLELVKAIAMQNGYTIMSTGMSTLHEVVEAVSAFKQGKETGNGVLSKEDLGKHLGILHCCSEYPTPLEHINLSYVTKLQRIFKYHKIGYSSHDATVVMPVCVVALGATIIECHITSNRSQAGSDHSASLEFVGMETLVRHIRAVEQAIGDGKKHLWEGEQKIRDKVKQVAKT